MGAVRCLPKILGGALNLSGYDGPFRWDSAGRAADDGQPLFSVRENVQID